MSRFSFNSSSFNAIPGSLFAYWFSNDLISVFSKGISLKTFGDTRQGMATSDNNRFLRLWYETNFNKIGFGFPNSISAAQSNKKWFPYNKGGEFRKWYGNQDYVINYEHDGKEVKDYATKLYKTPTRTIKSISEYFKESISWSKISTGNITFRFYPNGFIFDVAGCCIFYNGNKKQMLNDFAFVNSCVAKYILKAISPTVNFEAGQVATLPIINGEDVEEIVLKNIELCKQDWDSFEVSWDFKKHPLI